MIRAAINSAFDWSGRSGRGTLWGWLVFAALLALVLTTVEVWLAGSDIHAPRWTFLPLALLVPPLVGTAVRRLHDCGRAGGWLVLLALPWIGLLLLAYLLAAPGNARADRAETSVGLQLAGVLLTGLVVLLVAGRAFWTPYLVTSTSMVPSLFAGDYLIARHLGAADMARGDIVAFRHPTGPQTYVKRLIALAGDTVQMQAGRILLNGRLVGQAEQPAFAVVYAPQGPMGVLPRCGNAPVGAGGQCVTARFRESLGGAGAGYDVLDIAPGMASDDTAVLTVPAGHVFVMGDNRDDSLDSRFDLAIGGLGFVPADHIVARVDAVLFSAGSGLWSFWNWRGDRFLLGVP